MLKSTKINTGLISGGALCQAATVFPPGSMPGWAFSLVAFTCALVAGTRIVSGVDPRGAAEERAHKPHRTGIGALVVGLILASFSLGGCASVQDRVEVYPPVVDASGDVRVVMPLKVYGVVVLTDVACEVDIEDLRPLCGVCIEVAGTAVCRCWRGAERVQCPIPQGEGVEAHPGAEFSGTDVDAEEQGAEADGASTAPGEGAAR